MRAALRDPRFNCLKRCIVRFERTVYNLDPMNNRAKTVFPEIVEHELVNSRW